MRHIHHEFQIRCRLHYQFETAGWLLLNVAAGNNSSQRVLSESFRNTAGIAIVERPDLGGAGRFHALTAGPGSLEIAYDAVVARDVQLHDSSWNPSECQLLDLPADVVPFLYPSRYCESDKIVRFAAKEFGNLDPGHTKVVGICNWIHEAIAYEPGSTDEHTSAVECLTRRAGVCRDFAHVGITICRALGIPARYASAYAWGLPTQDFHAFFEVWLDGVWWYYDATRLAPQPGFVFVGCGHDAADTSVATMSVGVLSSAMEIEVTTAREPFPEYQTSPVTFQET